MQQRKSHPDSFKRDAVRRVVACGSKTVAGIAKELVLRVSRSGYYKWLHAEPSTRAIDDTDAAEVTEVFREHRGRYGALRVRRVLRRRGSRPSKNARV